MSLLKRAPASALVIGAVLIRKEDAMRRRVTVLLLATLSVLGGLAPAAWASADPDEASCVAQFTSYQGPGEVGETISFLSHEAQPFGTTVVSMGAGLKPPCE